MKFRILIVLLVSLHSFYSFSQDNKGSYSLLWEVSGKGLKKPSYLFGTMHLRDSRVFEFSDSVLTKLDQCEGFAIEIHPDSLVGGRFSYMYYDPTGIPVSMVVRDSSKHGLEELKYHTPYIVRSFYERSRRWDLDKPVFLDAYLFNLAKKQGKKTLAVETIEEHINLADHVSAIDLGLKFKFKLNFFSNNDESDDYIDIYRSGNIFKLDSFMHRSWYNKASLFNLLDKRNFVMARRADSLMQIRSMFIAVGSAHLPGDNGLINLLKKKGYTLKRVPATFTNFKDAYIIKEKDIPWYELKQDHYGYSVQLPGTMYAGPEKPDTFKLHTFVDSGNNLVYNTFCINYSKYRDSIKGPALVRKLIISALESEGEPEQNYAQAFKSKKSGTKKTENKVVYVHDIVQNGVSGKDVVIKCTDSLFIRMQIFDKDYKVYVNRLKLPEDMLESNSSKKFFNSFKVYPSKPYKEVKPLEYKNNVGGFSINFSNPPLRNKITYYKTAGDTLSDNYTEYYLITANIPNHTYSYIMYGDNELMYHARTDSNLLDYIMDDHARQYGTKIGKTVKLQEKGIAGIEQDFRDWDDTRVKVRCYIRGTRNYVLVDKYESDSDNDSTERRAFIDSFRFTDLKNEMLKPFAFKSDGISMQLPVSPFIARDTFKIVSRKRYNDEDEYYEEYDYDSYSYYSRGQHFPLTGNREGLDMETRFESIDKYNGSTYRMNVQHFSKYFRVANIDSLYKERLLSYTKFMDSTLYEKDFTLNGIKGKEIGFYTDSLSYDQKLRMILVGDRLFTWTARTPKELAGLKQLNAFMESIKIDPAKNANAIQSPKGALIMNDLISPDSVTALNASIGLRYYTFDRNEYPLIYKALGENYPDDTLMARSLRSAMLLSLKDSSDAKTIGFLDNLYPSLKAYPWLQADVLGVLAASKEPAAMNSFFNLLNTNVPDVSNAWQARNIFGAFYDSTARTKAYFKMLAELLESDNKYISMQASLLLHTTVFGDSIPDVPLVDKNKKILIEGLKKNLELYKNVPDSLQYEYLIVMRYISATLYLMSQDEDVNYIVQKLSKCKDLESQLNAYLAMIKTDKKINLKTLTNMLKADNYLAYEFVKKAYQNGKINSLPKEYNSQRKIAELCLWNYFGNTSSGVPDSVIYLKEKTITYKGEKVKMYVFKCRFEYNGDSYSLAISGPQPVDSKKINFDDVLTKSDWRTWTHNTSEERIDEIISDSIKESEGKGTNPYSRYD